MLQHVGVNRLGFGFRFGQFDGIAMRIDGERRSLVIVRALDGVLQENHIVRIFGFLIGRQVGGEKIAHFFVVNTVIRHHAFKRA